MRQIATLFTNLHNETMIKSHQDTHKGRLKHLRIIIFIGGRCIMKKIKQTIVTLAAVLAPIAMAPVVSAVGTCANGYTGPDSNNLCKSTTTYECTVNNNNTVTIVNDNTQVAVSGGATSGENTSGGNTQTGTATNNNGVTFNVTVTNGGGGGETGICTATATVPATPTPEVPVTPTPGKGAVAVVAPSTTAPKALAKTSGDQLSGYVVGAIVALASTLGLSRIALSVYGRLKA